MNTILKSVKNSLSGQFLNSMKQFEMFFNKITYIKNLYLK